MTKHVEFSQTQYIGKAVAVTIVIQRQVPQVPTAATTVKVSPVQFIGKAVDVPEFMPLLQRQVPQTHGVL